MELKQALEEALARPVTTADDADRLREIADLLGSYLRVEERARAVLGEELREGAGSGDLFGLSLDDAAERVLEGAGLPLHVHELGARIKARGWRHPRSKRARPDQIYFQLAARLPRDRRGRFRRVAPNTFGLARWDEGASPKARPRPRVGLFRGPQGATGRDISESVETVTSEGSQWRSS